MNIHILVDNLNNFMFEHVLSNPKCYWFINKFKMEIGIDFFQIIAVIKQTTALENSLKINFLQCSRSSFAHHTLEFLCGKYSGELNEVDHYPLCLSKFKCENDEHCFAHTFANFSLLGKKL